MCGRRFASPRRRYEPARGAEDALRFGGRVDSRGDAVPHLLDGLDRAQAGQGHLEPDARVVSVERDARQLSYRDEPAVLLERRRQQPHRRPLSCRHLHRAGVPGGGLRGALRLPWPDCVRRDVIAVQMVPLNALVIPVYLLLDSVGQVDSLLGVIAYYLAIVLPFMIWTLRGFVANVPVDLEEAAMVDGATRVSAFVRIVFPLVAPGLVATAIYGFIQAWNEYIIAYVLLSSNSKQTLTIWLASFTTQHGTDWGGLMAGATLTALPVVVFFLIVQRHVVGGLTAGAVKG